MSHIVHHSKFLSLVLRHRPDKIGLHLDPNGWAEVDELLLKMKLNGHPLDFQTLVEVVQNNNKQRFAFSEDNRLIRANQGHSVEVDLALVPQGPPPVLYHGTAEKNLASIQVQGLLKGNRHHVHLSSETTTAQKVGARHGLPVVLEVDAAGMHAAGYFFYRSENGVWLTDFVPPEFLR